MPGQNEKGFTLIEMVVSMTLLAVLAATAVPFIRNGVQAYNDTASGLQTVGKLRYASERIARELREIQRDGVGNFDITTPVNVSDDNITFRKSDGEEVIISDATPLPLVNMRYRTTLGDNDFVLTDELTSITFSYYLDDGISQANNTSDVAYIEFELILNNGSNYSQRTRVALRNQL